MSDPQFIDEESPEAAVHLTVIYRQGGNLRLAAPRSQATELVAAHSSRDPTARHMMHLLRGKTGLYSFDLDEIATLYVTCNHEQTSKSLLNEVVDLSS